MLKYNAIYICAHANMYNIIIPIWYIIILIIIIPYALNVSRGFSFANFANEGQFAKL